MCLKKNAALIKQNTSLLVTQNGISRDKREDNFLEVLVQDDCIVSTLKLLVSEAMKKYGSICRQ